MPLPDVTDSDDSSTPLDLAIVGCGRVVELYHVPALTRSLEWNVVGVCDPLIERREWIRGRFERAHVSESFAGLLDGCRPTAALVATPPSTHCDAVVRALETGMHVLVEKPMALSAADADRMCSAALGAGKHLGVGFSRRFSRSYLELRERLLRRPAPEVESIRFDLVGNAAAWKAVTDFLGDDLRGGGALDDMAPHQMDLLAWLLHEDVSRVRASRNAGTTDRPDQGIAYELEFANGLVASCSVGHGPRHERLHVLLRDRQLIADADRVFELPRRSPAWTRATCHVRRLADRLLRRQQAPEDVVTPFAIQLRSFAAAVRGSDRPGAMADGASGAHIVRVVAACRQSMRSGGSWVPVEPSSTPR
jgi:predicted dehydrogenase